MLTFDGCLMRLLGRELNTNRQLLKFWRQVKYFADFRPKTTFLDRYL
jgi:hypothetical protein